MSALTGASLSDAMADRLFDLVCNELAYSDLRAPRMDEPEPTFTARVLAPCVQTLLDRVTFRGLHLSGDGAAPVRTVELLGLPFRPDLSVSHFARHVLGVEVKYLRGVSRQNALATAFGQGLIYGKRGFERVIVFLVDREGATSEEQLLSARAAVADSFRLIVRRRVSPGDRLAPDVGRS